MFHPGLTLLLVVRDVPALLIEFSAAIVTWLPVMSLPMSSSMLLIVLAA